MRACAILLTSRERQVYRKIINVGGTWSRVRESGGGGGGGGGAIPTTSESIISSRITARVRSIARIRLITRISPSVAIKDSRTIGWYVKSSSNPLISLSCVNAVKHEPTRLTAESRISRRYADNNNKCRPAVPLYAGNDFSSLLSNSLFIPS